MYEVYTGAIQDNWGNYVNWTLAGKFKRREDAADFARLQLLRVWNGKVLVHVREVADVNPELINKNFPVPPEGQ